LSKVNMAAAFNGIFKFDFLARVVSEISGGPKFTLRGPTPPPPDAP